MLPRTARGLRHDLVDARPPSPSSRRSFAAASRASRAALRAGCRTSCGCVTVPPTDGVDRVASPRMSPRMLRTTSRRSAPSKLSTTLSPVACTGGAGGKPPPGCWPFTSTPVPLKMRAFSSAVGSPGCSARSAASASAGDIACVPFVGEVRMRDGRAAARASAAAMRRPTSSERQRANERPRIKGGIGIVVIRLAASRSRENTVIAARSGFGAAGRRDTCRPSEDRGRCREQARPPPAGAAGAGGRCAAGPDRRRVGGSGVTAGVEVCAWAAACAARAARRRSASDASAVPASGAGSRRQPPRAALAGARCRASAHRAGHCAELHRRPRIGRHPQHQLLGFVAQRQPHAIGLHFRDQHAVDRLALLHAARLAAGDLAQERRVLAADHHRAGQRELAALHPRFRGVADEHAAPDAASD